MNMRITPVRLLLLGLGLIALSQCSVPRPTSGSDSGRPYSRPSNSEMRLRQDIVAFAKKFEGTKYKYAGKTPKTGFDCSGFTSYVMDRYNIDLSASSSLQENQGRKIDPDRVTTGDLIFYRRSPGGRVFHVSLVVDNDREGIKVIHATSRGVVIDNISTSSYWKPKISTARDVISG